MVSGAVVAGMGPVPDAGATKVMSSWDRFSDLGLKICHASVTKTSNYVAYMDACEANGDCFKIVSGVLTPIAKWATEKSSHYFCNLKTLDTKIDEIHLTVKESKDISLLQELKEKLEALHVVRDEFIKLFGHEMKSKDIKLEDKKHLVGSKTYKHAEPVAVHVEEEEVSA